MDNEAHICNTDNGHVLSPDCWCEPTDIRIVINYQNIPVLVVFHVDYHAAPRALIIAHRTLCVNEPYENIVGNGWITRVLNLTLKEKEKP